MRVSKPIKIVIAGGGTGGHLFPGIAVAQAFEAKAPGTEVLFVGGKKDFEKNAVKSAGFEHRALSVEGLKGRGLFNQIKALVKLCISIFSALGILIKFRPKLVLGVGGYASAPCVMAAFPLFIKTAIQEQNLAPGLTNRVLGRLAGRIYVSFAGTMDFFKAGKVRIFGNPVRKGLLSPKKMNLPQLENRTFTVLILGGSQGARGINKAMTDALTNLRRPGQFSFIHQTGEKDLIESQRAYEFWGGDAVVKPFFNDMEKQYGEADLVICRAGASTVAELTALGKPAIFIPFPQAADNHQEKNARALEEADAAEVILESALSGSILADRIIHYENDREALKAMGQKAGKLGRPGAAGDIAEDVLAWITRN